MTPTASQPPKPTPQPTQTHPATPQPTKTTTPLPTNRNNHHHKNPHHRCWKTHKSQQQNPVNCNKPPQQRPTSPVFKNPQAMNNLDPPQSATTSIGKPPHQKTHNKTTHRPTASRLTWPDPQTAKRSQRSSHLDLSPATPLVSWSLQNHEEEPLLVLLLARNCREIELPSDRDLPVLVLPAAFVSYGEVNQELVRRDSDLPAYDRLEALDSKVG